ncbi:MAG: hypothetical protein DRP08_04055, partial [Candidatus Aenigmatarchaeota archaeon]
LTVSGTTFHTQHETVEIVDNLLLINEGEVGPGVTVSGGHAGIEVDRGSSTNYRFVFDEVNDNFKVGETGDLQPVATREALPTANGVAYWDSANYRFITMANMTFDGDLKLTDNTKIYFGDDDDSFIVQNGGTALQLQNTSTGGVYIDQHNVAGGIYLRTGATPTVVLTIDSDQNATFAGKVSITKDGSATEEYFSAGVSDDLKLYHNGAASYLLNTTGYFYLQNQSSNNLLIDQKNAAGAILLRTGAAPTTAVTIGATQNATFAGNIKVTDSKYVYIGADNDLYMQHDGSHSYIGNKTGNLYLRNDTGAASPLFIDNSAGSISLRTDDAGTLATAMTITTSRAVQFSTHVQMLSDTGYMYFGAGSDAYLRYNGTNMLFYPTVDITSGLSLGTAAAEWTTITYQAGTSHVFKTANGTTALTIDSSQNATFEGDITVKDNNHIYAGSDGDIDIYHTGYYGGIDCDTGGLYIDGASGSDIFFRIGSSLALKVKANLDVDVSYDLDVGGALSKGSGTFDIPHPIPEKESKGYRLRHSFVESPTRGDNIYRFEVDVNNNTTTIDLPDYFKYLNENAEVWCNPDKHFGVAFGYVEDNKLIVEANTDGKYKVLVIATRKDEIAVKNFDPKGIEYVKEEK